MKRTIRRINRLTNTLLTISGVVLFLYNAASMIGTLPAQRERTIATAIYMLTLFGRSRMLKRWGLG